MASKTFTHALCITLGALLLALQTVHAKMHWGVASSGFQHEGYFPDSNWIRYVQAGASISDPYRNSVDHYHRYLSDIALAKAMGVNTFRFSIEWARIEPAQGVLNQTELQHYDNVVNAVIAAGMTPMITLDHWVYPGWVLDQGGWTDSGIVSKWLSHARTIVTRYAGKGALWITINEPTEYLSKEQTYRKLNVIQQAIMLANLIQTHRSAYDLIHQLDPGALVSSNLAYEPPPLQMVMDAEFFDHVIDKLDFIAIDYYYGLSLNNWSVVSALNGDIWDIKPQPDGLYYALMSYHSKAPSLPFYIVENGMPTNNGNRTDGITRSVHLLDHIYWLQRAAADGLTIIGYNYWSLTDNYEWGTYQPRFGLYKVDVLTDPTLTRTPTDAVATYKQIIAAGGVPAGYTPVIAPSLCNAASSISVCIGQIVSLVGGALQPKTAAPTQWWQGFLPGEQNSAVTEQSTSPGTIGGAVIGSTVGVSLIALAGLIVVRRRRRASSAGVNQDEVNGRNSMVLAAPASSDNPLFLHANREGA